MNEIETPLTHATVAETAYLASDSSKIIKKKAIEDPYLNKLGTELEDAGNKMEKSIATSRKKAFTEKLAKADDKRDAAFNALKLFIQGYIRWNIEAYLPYALKIWDILKRHGLGLDQESYGEESGLMGSLIKDLEKPEIAEAITILKQEEVVAYLKDSHAGFSALYQTAVETEAGKENIISATKLKKGALAKLKSTVEYLNAVVCSKPEIYGTVHAEMAELINNLNHKIRLRNK